ncbi:hypothetical protein IAD21_03672 [Abditibacteriota bacterium]|nr:hypothetical protein IAD21_03672 [Abditibacteriota bacterium]
MFKSVVGIALGLLCGMTGAHAQTGLPQGTLFYQFYNRNNGWIDAAPGRNFNAQITRTSVPGGPQLVGVDCYGITFDPNTRQMCFARTLIVPKGKFKGDPIAFYLSNLDGSNARLLHRERLDYSGESEIASDFTPHYATNGDLLFETGNRIARMNGDGSNVRFLTGANESCGSPAESNGVISFEKSGVCVCDAQGKNRRRIASFPTYYGSKGGEGGAYTDSKVSPDTKQIAYASGNQIYVASLSDSAVKPRRVSDTTRALDYSDPVWSPDGRFLAVGGTPRGSELHDIYLINVSTGKMRQITNDPADELPSDWRLVP